MISKESRGVNCVVKNRDRVVFTSRGKWLHPLFELEDFLRESREPREELSLEDKIIGRGAAVLIARLGIPLCRGRLMSRRALPILERHGVRFSWETLVDALDCATETALTDEMSLDEAYRELARRAGRL